MFIRSRTSYRKKDNKFTKRLGTRNELIKANHLLYITQI